MDAEQFNSAHGSISITETGLPDDVFNVWADLNSSHMLLQLIEDQKGVDAVCDETHVRVLENLNNPRESYEEYADAHFSLELREQMRVLLNPNSIAAFNELVREFNLLASQKKIDKKTAKDFFLRAGKICG